MLDAQTVDIIVTGSRSSHLIFSTVRSVTSSCFHNHKLALPLFFFFLSSPCALSLLFCLSLCSAHWYKYTKMWPDREGHNWLPVQCVSASCSVTQKTWPSWGWCCRLPRRPKLYTLQPFHLLRELKHAVLHGNFAGYIMQSCPNQELRAWSQVVYVMGVRASYTFYINSLTAGKG